MKTMALFGEQSMEIEEYFTKKVTKFSNVAHLIVKKELVGKTVIVVLPRVPMTRVLTATAKQKKDKTWTIGELK